MTASNNSLQQLANAVSGNPVRLNENFDALSQAAVFGRDPITTTGLTWGYLGGSIEVDGAHTAISSSTIALTASTTNYVERTRAGVVSANTTGFTAGRVPLYTATTSASLITAYTDHRRMQNEPGVAMRLTKSVAGGSDVTLTAAEARCDILNFTGTLTANINVIVPVGPQEWTVSNNTSGAFTLTVKTAAGTGVAVAQGAATLLFADGVNVVAAGIAAAVAASAVTVADAGNYYAGSTVEAVLQELGAAGANAMAMPAQRWTIDRDSTADSDPGAGLLKFNHATPSSATVLYVDDETVDAIDLSTYFAALGATGFVKLISKLDASEWMIFRWTAVVDGTGYFKFTVAHQASRGTLDDADEVLVTFDSDANTGGGGGTELRGLTFTSDLDSTADSDPGAGLMKWNHATQGSATKLFFDNSTLDSITITTFFAALGTDATLYMQQADDSSRWQLWEIDTATADSGYYDFAVTLLAKSSSDIQDNKAVLCDFERRGTSGGGDSKMRGDVFDHFAPTSNAATIDTLANGTPVLAFDGGSTNEAARWKKRLPSNFSGSTIDVVIRLTMESATSGNVRFGGRVMPQASDLSVDAFGSAIEAHVAVAADVDDVTTITLSSISVGSAVAGDEIVIELYRDASDTTNDTASGFAYLHDWHQA